MTQTARAAYLDVDWEPRRQKKKGKDVAESLRDYIHALPRRAKRPKKGK